MVEVMTGRAGRLSRWKSLGIRRTGDQSGRGRRTRPALEDEDVTTGGRAGGSPLKEKLERYYSVVLNYYEFSSLVLKS